MTSDNREVFAQQRAELMAELWPPEAPTDADPDRQERLLKSREVAILFNVTGRTVTNWVNAGVLACLRTPGGYYRFHAGTVRALLESVNLAPVTPSDTPPDLPMPEGAVTEPAARPIDMPTEPPTQSID